MAGRTGVAGMKVCEIIAGVLVLWCAFVPAAWPETTFERGKALFERGEPAPALALIRQAARNGDVAAQRWLAALHVQSPLFPRPAAPDAAYWYLQLARRNDPDALLRAAMSLTLMPRDERYVMGRDGEFVLWLPDDFHAPPPAGSIAFDAERIQSLIRRAMELDRESAVYTEYRFMAGWDAEKGRHLDRETCSYLRTHAGPHGYVRPELVLAMANCANQGYWGLPYGSKSAMLSLRFLHQAAEAGYPPAQAQWGNHLVRHSKDRPWARLARALEAAGVIAPRDIDYPPGDAYYTRPGTHHPRRAEGLGWIRRALEAGEPLAMYVWGRALYEGWDGAPGRDRAAGLRWMMRAAMVRESRAVTFLSFLVKHGMWPVTESPFTDHWRGRLTGTDGEVSREEARCLVLDDVPVYRSKLAHEVWRICNGASGRHRFAYFQGVSEAGSPGAEEEARWWSRWWLSRTRHGKRNTYTDPESHPALNMLLARSDPEFTWTAAQWMLRHQGATEQAVETMEDAARHGILHAQMELARHYARSAEGDERHLRRARYWSGVAAYRLAAGHPDMRDRLWPRDPRVFRAAMVRLHCRVHAQLQAMEGIPAGEACPSSWCRPR